MPEQHYRAFLDLLGPSESHPSQPGFPSRSYLRPAVSSSRFVPVHTPSPPRLKASSQSSSSTREAELATTRAELIAAYVVRQDLLWAQDVTALVTGATAGQFALPGSLGGSPFSNSSHAQQYLLPATRYSYATTSESEHNLCFRDRSSGVVFERQRRKVGWWDGQGTRPPVLPGEPGHVGLAIRSNSEALRCIRKAALACRHPAAAARDDRHCHGALQAQTELSLPSSCITATHSTQRATSCRWVVHPGLVMCFTSVVTPSLQAGAEVKIAVSTPATR